MKRVFITGVLGQDGAYLSQYLLEKGYRIYGGVRPSGARDTWRLDHFGIAGEIEFVECDLGDQDRIDAILKQYQPDEFYNLAAQSFVARSFEEPVYTSKIDGIGVLYILEAIRHHSPHTRFYQASSSEIFGRVHGIVQDESTPFYPVSPYGVAKLFGHCMTINYRDAYGLYACCGIFFNHESPLRGIEYVTRKITDGLARVQLGLIDVLSLGNLDARRDWGYAGDYVELMHLMLSQDRAEDYVVATGETHSAREFAELAGQAIGMEIEWVGEGVEGKGIDRKTGKVVIDVNEKFYRPTEIGEIRGSARRAADKLGWKPKVSFEDLVRMMARQDYDRVKANTAPGASE